MLPLHIVLIHSPLVGPYTWHSVGEHLQRHGATVTIPTLTSPPELLGPYWRHHRDEVVAAIEAAGREGPVILVAHSGAGPLMAAVAEALPQGVAATCFVDAMIPEDGKSRLDLFESSEAADGFRQTAEHGLLPTWSEEALREVIPDEAQRRAFVAELRPLPLAVYTEPLPVPPGWPGHPCIYLRFGANPSYDAAAAQAAAQGWMTAALPGNHFLLLNEPATVAETLWHLVHSALSHPTP